MDQKITKEQLHDYIHQSDLKGLKQYVDQGQRSLLAFDDPSLILLAIEVYLDPHKLVNQEFQLEIIKFLLQCGIYLWVPKGSITLYIFNHCQQKITENKENVQDQELKEELEAEYFEQKLLELFDQLLEQDQMQLIKFKPPATYFKQAQDYLYRNWAALKIQNCYRGYRAKKDIESQKILRLKLE